MRQRTYSRGGSGRNGGSRYQARARKLHARRSRSRARRGLTTARSVRRKESDHQRLERDIVRGIYTALSAVSAALPPYILTAYDRATVPVWILLPPAGRPCLSARAAHNAP